MQDHEQGITGDGTPTIRVERAAWRDLRAVAAIQQASFRPGLAYGMTALGILRALPGAIFLVARTDALPVAGCVIGDRHRGNLRIMNLAVAPGARRQGVATALLRRIEHESPNGNVVLMAEEWNTGAQALYAREGYIRDGVARDYYGRGRNGIWMKKVRAPGDNALRV
jgi:ribosomal protein S18 acetylase RimI-like enzyme